MQEFAVLSANNDAGREYMSGLREGLGSKASLVVKEATYDGSEANLESQLRDVKESGADVFMNFCIGVMATQAIHKAAELDWHPLQFIPNASLSVAAFLEPAGLEKAAGLISNARSKGWHTAESQRDPAVRDFLEWMNKYNGDANLRDQNNVAGYERAEALVEVLKNCGNDLSRANVMNKFASGNPCEDQSYGYQPIKQLFLIQFDSKEWKPLGPISSDDQPVQ